MGKIPINVRDETTGNKKMGEFCSEHGDGKIWCKNAENYGGELI